MNYLLITLIPFRRSSDGAAIVDGLWAEDLRGLRSAVGNVTVAAPEIQREGNSKGWWGTGDSVVAETEGICFVGLPSFRNSISAWFGTFRLRSILRREVDKADIVHSSNFFEPYMGMAYAHHLAVRRGKKTVFVVAEDFRDMQEWVFAEKNLTGLSKWRSLRMVATQDKMVRQCVSSASISFLHTPASVHRYRLCAPRGMAIRQPVHEAADVVTEATLAERAAYANGGAPLRLVVACRLAPLKGIDFLLRAIRLLKTQKVALSLDIYGLGLQKEELVALTHKLCIEDQVHFHEGLPSGPMFRKALECCDVAVMAHLTTDFGRAFWDALAAGLPVIAFHSNAATHTVRDRLDGLLAPMADVEGLADRIRQVHLDRALLESMSTAARERALVNTRSIWNSLRAARIQELLQPPIETSTRKPEKSTHS
jgi:glycosyltransferase involved in cell wall biosynthesis